jgi:hypothetical protein
MYFTVNTVGVLCIYLLKDYSFIEDLFNSKGFDKYFSCFLLFPQKNLLSCFITQFES